MPRILVLLGAIAQAPAPSGPLDPAAYDVYTAVFALQGPLVDGRAKRLVIQDTARVAGCFPSGEPLNSGDWKLKRVNRAS